MKELSGNKDNQFWLFVAFWASLFTIICSQELSRTLLLILEPWHISGDVLLLIKALPHHLLTLIIILITCKYINPELSIREKLQLERVRWFYPVIGLGIALFLLPVNIIVTVCSGVFFKYFFKFIPTPDIQQYLLDCSNLSFTVFFIAAVFLAPVTEELFFRRLMYSFLTKYVSVPIAFIMTSLIFAAIHFNLLQLGGLFVLALALQGVVLIFNSLYPAIFLHFFNNLCSMSLLCILRYSNLQDNLPV